MLLPSDLTLSITPRMVNQLLAVRSAQEPLDELTSVQARVIQFYEYRPGGDAVGFRAEGSIRSADRDGERTFGCTGRLVSDRASVTMQVDAVHDDKGTDPERTLLNALQKMFAGIYIGLPELPGLSLSSPVMATAGERLLLTASLLHPATGEGAFLLASDHAGGDVCIALSGRALRACVAGGVAARSAVNSIEGQAQYPMGPLTSMPSE